jgi:hypothetical protein
MLKLLADENIAVDMLAWLRGQSCDVVHASEQLAQEADSVLLKSAEAEGVCSLPRTRISASWSSGTGSTPMELFCSAWAYKM